MKIFTSIIFGLVFLVQTSTGQHVPQGMKYQAVARNLKGEIMSNQDLQLKITLYSDQASNEIGYVEIHKVITSEIGLFSLTIGEGVKTQGGFKEIPWSTNDIWMKVEVQTDDETDFITISDSKMLSVPYAFHAATASELIGSTGNGRGDGDYTESKFFWNICGNLGTDSEVHKLGTIDRVDLVFVTTNIERMRILWSGDISIANSLIIDEDLTVEQNVNLNTIGGETINNGNLTVGGNTLLMSDLNVDGPTYLHNILQVEGNTLILDNTESTSPSTGALVVVGGVGIGSNLNVGGDFSVDGASTFKGMVHITDLTQSTSTTTGALVVDGGVGIGKRLNVGGVTILENTLTVKEATLLEKTLDVGGKTLIKDLTQSTSTTTGALVVNGGVGIAKRLNVGEATKLDSTLDVYGATAINNTLTVSGITNLNNAVNVTGITTITNTTQSTTKDNGALIIEGGVGIEKNLNVGGSAGFGGPVSLGGIVNITDLTQSTSTSNGALIVAGGVGIGKRLNVAGATKLESNLDVVGPTAITNTLNVTGITTLTNTTQSTTKDNGALVVEGGVGIEKNISVGGDANFTGMVALGGMVNITDLTESTNTTTGALKVGGGVGIGKRLNVGGAAGLNSTLNVTGITSLTNSTESSAITNGGLVVSGGVGISKNLNVGGSTILNKELTVKGTGALGGHVASFENTVNGNGISIKVGAPTPHNNNNFVTFLNSTGGVVGRIEGENGAGDLANNNDYQRELAFLNASIGFAAVDEAIAIAEVVQATAELIAATTSATACVGFGACLTAPIPSLIVAAIAGEILSIANLVAVSGVLALTIAQQVTFVNLYASQFGVTYQSGAGDYAEYLPKLNPEEKFSGGDIVGLKHGFITKNTDGAERIMVISHNPIVLGKLPVDGREDLYEMVAFLGQVPTKVIGEVLPGDYILSNGYHNGFGIARNPKNMKIDDYKRILGLAWEGAEDNKVNMVNVAIGLNTNDLTGVIQQQADLIEQQAADMEAMKYQMTQTHTILAELVPGFKESIQNNPLFATEGPTPENRSGSTKPTLNVDESHEIHIVEPGSDDIVYFKVTRDQLEEAIIQAEKMSITAGIDTDVHPFWIRLHNDPSYKEELLSDLEVKLEHAYHTHQQINKSKGN